jgi:phosphate transport system substrate-binding protein
MLSQSANNKEMITMVNKLLILLTFVALLPQAALAELSYIGSSTIGTGILTAGAVAAFEKKSGKKFKEVAIPGSNKGIEAVVSGKSELAGVSREIKPEERKAGLVGTIIGYDALTVFVNKNNPVKNLSKEQIKGIFTGKITNWKEVGGKNAPIVPNTENLDGKRATVQFFQEHVMDGAAFGNFKRFEQQVEQLVEVAKDENAVCGISHGLLSAVAKEHQAKVKSVNIAGTEPTPANVQSGSYFISRPLNLVTKGLPKGDVKEFISFILSPEGQAIVGKNFVPVRKK